MAHRDSLFSYLCPQSRAGLMLEPDNERAGWLKTSLFVSEQVSRYVWVERERQQRFATLLNPITTASAAAHPRPPAAPWPHQGLFCRERQARRHPTPSGETRGQGMR